MRSEAYSIGRGAALCVLEEDWTPDLMVPVFRALVALDARAGNGECVAGWMDAMNEALQRYEEGASK